MAPKSNLTKKTILLTFILAGFSTTGTFAQQYNNLVRIDSTDLSYEFHVTTETLKPKLSLTYFWFNSGRIHQNDGGYDGKLLHGEYKVTDLQQRLIIQGNFRMGRKWGTWYTWHTNGKLRSVTRYRPRDGRQTIEEYDAQGNWSRKGYIKNDLFTGRQQERIKDSSFVVTYKKGIRKERKNDVD
jgi:antitoxin component YwqK of YwqJK toxin-antitoxin module